MRFAAPGERLTRARCAAQYLGDFETLQEMEDAGELGPLLRGD